MHGWWPLTPAYDEVYVDCIVTEASQGTPFGLEQGC